MKLPEYLAPCVLLASLLAGCGGSSGSGNGGTTADTTPPSAPSIGAMMNVAANSLIRIPYTETLGAAGEVVVIDEMGRAVFGSTSLDGDGKTVVFTPARVLASGMSYAVSFSGAEDAAGNEDVTGGHYHFRTQDRYLSLQDLYLGGAVWNALELERDLDAHTYYEQRYSDKGPDGTWHTDDDVPEGFYVQGDLDDNGRPLDAIFLLAGDDGVPRNADDLVTYRREFEYNDLGQVTHQWEFMQGADGVYGTEDDRRFALYRYEYSSDSRLLATTYYTNAGTDQEWETADDVIQFVEVREHDDAGYIEATYVAYPGADGLPGTDDDLLNDYISYAASLQDSEWSETEHDGAGEDGNWGTADDVIGQRRVTALDMDGGRMVLSLYDAAQPDDIVDVYVTQLGEDRAPTELSYFLNAGADEVWLTQDDQLGSYQLYESDQTGAMDAATSYNDRGADLAWKTADDRLSLVMHWSP